nr:immunoglobulin light chain junction region [Macaca mulatta]
DYYCQVWHIGSDHVF